MRPKKQINPGAHRSGYASGGKGRFYTTGLPGEESSARDETLAPEPAPDPTQPGLAEKYVGRASVGPNAQDSEASLVIDLTQPREWRDPLDEDEFDLSSVTIDLRPTMRNRPAETYYERYSSKVPGHQ